LPATFLTPPGAAMYDQVTANKRRSWLLIAGFVLFVALVAAGFGYLLGLGYAGVALAIVISVVTSLVAYWQSDKVALRMSRARPAPVESYARYHNIVEGLCIASGLPKPRLYVIEDPAPNAFATGRNPRNAAVAVTTGLLEKLNRVELEGVLAHELSHVKNYDILVSTLAVTMVGIVALLADLGVRLAWWGMGRNSHRDFDRQHGGNGGPMAILSVVGFALLVLSPVIATVMQRAVSRRRETLADVSGVEMTRYPPGLISALEKLKDDTTVVHATSRATAHLWIEQPSAQTEREGRLSRFNRMFDTHPPIEQRIALLREL
jgi:heat shock protein HtpX